MKPTLDNFYVRSNPWLKDNILFLTVHGSRCYGTHTEESDWDAKGFCVPSKEILFGFAKNFDQQEYKEPTDAVIYNIKKFCKLASDCNPNIIEVLNTEEEDWIFLHPIGKKIIDNKHLFLSKKAEYTFAGYARDQLHLIQRHYRWLKTPPLSPPSRTEFGLEDKQLMDNNQLNAALTEITKGMDEWDVNWDLLERSERIAIKTNIKKMFVELKIVKDDLWQYKAKHLGFSDNFIEYLNKEKQYKQKLNDWHSYLQWQKSRNPKRKVIEEKYGYDTKNAYHLIRLLRMAEEIATQGKVFVRRPDAQELLEIRNGSLTYEQVVEYADIKSKEIEEIYNKSTLIPDRADVNKIDKLVQECITEFYGI